MSETKRVVVANAFSLGMIGNRKEATINITECSLEDVKKIIEEGFESAIGHEATAAFLSQLLGTEVPINRQQITLDESTVLVVFQLQSRLPEGKVLSEEELRSLQYKFYLVTVSQPTLSESREQKLEEAIRLIQKAIEHWEKGEVDEMAKSLDKADELSEDYGLLLGSETAKVLLSVAMFEHVLNCAKRLMR